MKSPAPYRLCLPGESEREFWLRDASGVARRDDAGASDANAVYVIEASSLNSCPFWAVAPHDGKTDVSGVAALKWESLGVPAEGPGKAWTHWIAGEKDQRVIVASAGLAEESAQTEWIRRMPETFELSPRLYPIPDNEAALWMELGRYVIAFKRGGQLLHFSMLTSRGLDADAAAEIRDLMLSLEVQGFLPRIAGLRVWTPAGTEFVKELQEALGAKVRVEPRPAPVMPEEQCDVFPPDVAQAKHEHLARRRRNRLVMALAFIYLLGFAGWAGTLMWKEKKIDAGFAGIDRLKPQIEEVRTLQMRWHAMEPATDPDQYPAEIFNHIVSLLPPEGICLKEFRFELDKVVVSCEASTVAHAMKFQADLEGAEGLKRFNWPTQQPRILDDNRATFYAEGTLKPGGGGS